MEETLLHVTLVLTSVVLYIMSRFLGRAFFDGYGLSLLDAKMGVWLLAMLVLGFMKGMDWMIPADTIIAASLLYVVITMTFFRKIGSWRKWGRNKKQEWWLASVMTPLVISCGLLVWATATGQ